MGIRCGPDVDVIDVRSASEADLDVCA